MATRTFSFLSFLLLSAILISSGSTISTTQKDITTPLTTVPITNPSTPTTTTPMLNPTDSGQDSPSITKPGLNPLTPTSTAGSWCVASQSASQAALQLALDYACGHGSADCSEIQPGGGCFAPVTVRDHASYAFNSYYQKNPIPTSCNFGGSAVTTSTDPSYGACQYPSTSTTSSVLNTSNSIGSRVFGAGPVTPSPSAAATRSGLRYFRPTLLLFISIFATSR